MSETHDCTRLDYAFRPQNGGRRGTVTCWSGSKPNIGDFVLLRNGDHTTRYRVTDVDLCMNVDPPTMWIARVKFAPRQFADAARTIEVDA